MFKIQALILISVYAILQAGSVPHCDKGWILYANKCYYFSNSTVLFTDDMVACYNIGAQLLEIKDRQEELWVDLQCRLRGYTYGTWLGFSDIQREGHYVSLSDGKKLGYVSWVRHEPSNSGNNEHCMMYWTTYRGWNDANCFGNKFKYTCTKAVN